MLKFVKIPLLLIYVWDFTTASPPLLGTMKIPVKTPENYQKELFGFVIVLLC